MFFNTALAPTNIAAKPKATVRIPRTVRTKPSMARDLGHAHYRSGRSRHWCAPDIAHPWAATLPLDEGLPTPNDAVGLATGTLQGLLRERTGRITLPTRGAWVTELRLSFCAPHVPAVRLIPGSPAVWNV